jgi:PAS domain S-box-containing protein
VESLLGYRPEEMLGKTPFEFMAAEDAETVAGVFNEIAGKEQAFSLFENTNLHRDGREIVLETSGVPFFDADGRLAGYRCIDRNITERKRAVEDAQRYQRDMAHVMRLSTMGEMATGMAHELNQPLAAIVMYCGTAASLVNSLPSPPQLGEMLERAKEQAHRAGDIIRHLREFVGKEGKDKEPIFLDQVIRDVIIFLKWEVQESGVTIELFLGGQKRKVTANKIQIEQVLVNLVRNSLEAIGHANITGGRVVIQTRLLPNNMIEVTVTDNGPGIDTIMAGKIFDQFQTSKETGLGVGLSLSRTIIEVHGGKLWVDKDHQNGALFGFELRVSD